MTAVSSRAGNHDRPFANVPTLPLLALGELALALVGLVTLVGLRRLFLGSEWFPPLLVDLVAAHLTVSTLRRRGIPTAPALAAAAAAGFLVIAWVHAGDATTYGIPTPATVEALSTSVGDAFSIFSEVKSPTEPLAGFVVACAFALWSGAIVADWAAFRADAAIESVLPYASLFAIAAVLGGDVDRMLISGMWTAAVLGFVLLRRADRVGHRSTWVGDRTGRGPRSLVALGLALTLATTLVAAVIGPRLPGAESDAIVSLTDIGGNGPGTRVTVSPLVDIRSRLVDQANIEVFTVRSDVRDYWRLTSLDRFDGRIWSSNGSYGKAAGILDVGVPIASQQIVVTQQFQIRALSQIWLPAAYEPRIVDVPQTVRYDEVSGTLIIDTDVPTSDGMIYAVRSSLPQHRPEALRAASDQIPDDIADRYLGLPADFSPAVRQLATDLTVGSGSVYEASLRLQDFFRSQFTYDLSIGPGHGDDAIESFVFDVRSGYCEQFAGSFAAMARSVGIPARVAVGFTPGVADPNDPNFYRVRGEHAHAWPEVFIGEYGWVKFEPTPGRGAPFAEQYTGVPEQQAASGGASTTATTTLTPPSTEVPDLSGQTPDANPDLGLPLPDEGLDSSFDPTARPNPWFDRIAVAAAVIAGLVALYLVAVLAVLAVRRSNRRRRATTPTAQVALAWDEALAVLRRADLPVRSSDTQSQTAARVGTRLPSVDGPLRTLASTVMNAAYSPEPPDEETGTSALALADEIGGHVLATLTPGERFKGAFHPGRLRDG